MKARDSLNTVLVLLCVVALAGVAAPGGVARMSQNDVTYGNSYSFTDRAGVSHISADGRYVTFYSWATNLHGDDPDSRSDVYVYDRDVDSLQLVSRRSEGGAKGNGNSTNPSISTENGCCVAFQSSAFNLIAADPDVIDDIYVYDRDADAIQLVSRKSASAGGAKDNSFSIKPAISADGRFVAYSSASTNLQADTVSEQCPCRLRSGHNPGQVDGVGRLRERRELHAKRDARL